MSPGCRRSKVKVARLFMANPKGLWPKPNLNPEEIIYFTGKITDAPDVDRGCRTKITVRLDGNAETLWKNWSHGLHRVTCYGDLAKDLERFCRFAKIKLVNEAART